MGPDREGWVYRVRQLPLHLDHPSDTAHFLASIAPDLGEASNIRVCSLAQAKQDSKTATVTFKTIPSVFENDQHQWTLPVESYRRQNVIVDEHFRGFTVLNEPRQCPHTVDCVAISGLASRPFGSWKYREPGSNFMWLRDKLPKDVPKLRSLIYGYDTKLSKSRSFQDLDDIAWSFIASLKEIRRSLPPARSLFFLAHSLGGIVLKRALVLLANGSSDEEKIILGSVKGLIFFGVPHRGMKISHFLAMAAKQPNEDLINSTLSPSSTLLPELSKDFSKIASHFNENIRYVYETVQSPLTEQNPSGTWVRSEVSYAILVNKDSAVPQGTPPRHTIAVNEDHSNMVKFAEDDPVYKAIMLFLLDLSTDDNDGINGHNDVAYPRASQTSRQGVQDPAKSSVSTIPFSRDPNFVGRKDILEQLESEVADPRSGLWASLWGLGGIGKSQIAIEYSYRQKARSPQISTFWVHVSSRARFEQSYVEIAKKAGVPETGDGKVDILHLVSKYLADESNGAWLLILDNADDATVLLEPSSSDAKSDAVSAQRRLLDFVPRVQHGTVIITTRDRKCALELMGYRGTPIEVLAMTLDESVELLRVVLPQAHNDEASELVRELENVPLAISQAGAYIKEVPRVSIPMYLAIFRRSKEDQVALLKKNKEDSRRDPGVPNAVVTSWERSFQQIRENSPDSADLLSLMAYLNRQAIPSFLIQGDVDEIAFEENINCLLSFSLIRAENREDIFEMHRLIQAAMQHWLRTEGSEQKWKKCAIEQVAQQFPRVNEQTEYWPTCEVLMSHVEAVLFYIVNSKDSQLSRGDILNRTAWYLMNRKGDYALAEGRSKEALQIQQRYFTEDSDEVLFTLTVLAEIKRRLGKIKEASDVQKFILKQCLKKRGPDDRDSLRAMHNLALSFTDLGTDGKAEKLMERVVEGMRRLPGSDSRDTLLPETLLVEIYLNLGKYQEAEKMGTKALERSARLYGLEHVVTLDIMVILSRAYVDLNRLEKAEGMIAQAIPILSKVYGPNSWRGLEARIQLARIYHQEHKFDEAKDICLSCLEDGQELQRSHNALRLRCSHLLGRIHRDQGKFADALKLLTDAVKSSRELWGDSHPGSLIFTSTLAICYYKMGDRDHAIRLMTEVIEKRRKVLSGNHPHTKDSAKWLAYWKGEEESEKRKIGETESEEGKTVEEVKEEDGIEEEEEDEVSEEEKGEQDENKDEATIANEESEEDDFVDNLLAGFHISAPASRQAESR